MIINMENNLTIDLGTINFWIKENNIYFNDWKITELFNLFPVWWSIFMLKDDDNKFKIMYVVIWKWRIDLEYDVSKLDSNIAHMFTITWDIKNSIKLYIDWKEVSSKVVSF